MDEVIFYYNGELRIAKNLLDRLLMLEDSYWDHENSFEWIIGWSNLIDEFINIRREHWGNKGNYTNPIIVWPSNRLGFKIAYNYDYLSKIANTVASLSNDSSAIIGAAERKSAHEYDVIIEERINL